MDTLKRTVAINRARRRVKTLAESDAPWPHQERARRQLRRVESACRRKRPAC